MVWSSVCLSLTSGCWNCGVYKNERYTEVWILSSEYRSVSDTISEIAEIIQCL